MVGFNHEPFFRYQGNTFKSTLNMSKRLFLFTATKIKPPKLGHGKGIVKVQRQNFQISCNRRFCIAIKANVANW